MRVIMNFLLLSLLIIFTGCSGHKTHWSYDGGEGPSHWASISEKYRQCGIGHKQSPINLSLKDSTTKEHQLKFYYHPTPAIIINNGHTIEFDMEEDNVLVTDNKRYVLKQFHFHSPSEHTLNGKHFPSELHLVHQSKDGHLAVVGVLIEVGAPDKQDHNLVDHIFDKVPKKKEKIQTEELHLEALVEKSTAHFYYQGSLTTPPCSEEVKWIVLDRHLFMSKEQLSHFTDFYDHNNRPIQGKFLRSVWHSMH